MQIVLAFVVIIPVGVDARASRVLWLSVVSILLFRRLNRNSTLVIGFFLTISRPGRWSFPRTCSVRINPILRRVADEVCLEVSVSALRVAVVGAEFEVGREKGAGMVASASV